MKIFTGFITCVMISMLMSISVLAIDGFMISVGNAECSAGEMVVVPISMIDAPNFFVATIEIEYDENMMTLLNVQDTGMVNGDEHSDKYVSPYTLTWVNNGGSVKNGVAAELLFKLSNDVKEDLHIKISISRDGVIDNNGDVLTPTLDNGIVYIIDNHEHDYGRWIEYNSVKHIRECDCGETEYARHDWDDGEVTRKPTENSIGVMTYTCDICDASKTETIPALEPDEYEITGTVTSYGDADEAVTVTLYDAYGDVVDSDTTTNGSYSLSAPEGTYILEVSKTKHCTREYTIIVSDSNVEQDVEIWLYGDVYTADGGVSMVDATQIQRYLSGKSSVFGSTTDTELEKYRLKVADIYTADGGVSMVDATQIQRYLSGKSSIFNTLP